MKQNDVKNIYLLEATLLLITTISTCSMVLLSFGVFNSMRALFVGILLFCLTIWVLRLRLALKDPRFDIKIFAIIILAFLLRLHFDPYLVGDQDPGLYTIMGKQFEITGKTYIGDSVRSQLPKKALALYDQYMYGRSAKLPGIAIINNDSHIYQMPFYPLYPCWLSISSKLFGDNNQQLISVVFSLLSIISFYLLGYLISNKNKAAGYLVALLLAINPLHIFYSTKPNTEVIALTFVSFAIYYLCKYYNDTQKDVYDWFNLFISCVLMNNFFYTRMSGFLYLPLFFCVAVITIFFSKSLTFRKHVLTYLLILFNLFFISNIFYFIFYKEYLFETVYSAYLGPYWQRYALAALVFSVGCLPILKYIKGSSTINSLISATKSFPSKYKHLISKTLPSLGIFFLGFLILAIRWKVQSTSFILYSAVLLLVINFSIIYKWPPVNFHSLVCANLPKILGTAALLIILISFIKSVYVLGFTNLYEHVYYTDNLVVNFKNGIFSFSSTVLYNVMLYISPIVLVLFFYSLYKLHNKITISMDFILLLAVYFWIITSLYSPFVGYPMYFARYFMSEIVPYTLLLVSLYIMSLSKQLRVLLITIIVLYFLPITVFYAIYHETASSSFYGDINKIIGKNDLLIVDGDKSKENNTYLVVTVLKYYFNYNVIYYDDLQALFAENELKEFYNFKNIYYLYSIDKSTGDMQNILCTDKKILAFDISFLTNNNIHRYGYLPKKTETKIFPESPFVLPAIYSTSEVHYKLCKLGDNPIARYYNNFKLYGIVDFTNSYIRTNISGLSDSGSILKDVEMTNLDLTNELGYGILDIDAHSSGSKICSLGVWVNNHKLAILNENKLTFVLEGIDRIDTIKISCSDDYLPWNQTFIDSIRLKKHKN